MDPAELFRSTSWYYHRYRPLYPTELFDHLMQTHNLRAGQTIVDLGCGTGRLAIPLARRGLKVIAVDPSPEMMDEGKRAMQEEETSGDVCWVQGTGEALSEAIDTEVDALVIGQAFHWMSQDLVLQQCDKVIKSSGGLSIVSGGMHMWTATEPRWCVVVKETVQEFLGEQRKAGSGIYQQPDEPFEKALARSGFKKMEAWSIKLEKIRTLDEVIGLQYSTSWASPHHFADRIDGFDQTLRQRLMATNPDGRFEEAYELTCFCAFR